MAARARADQAAEFARIVAHQQRRTASGSPAALPQLGTALALALVAVATGGGADAEARARAALIAAAL